MALPDRFCIQQGTAIIWGESGSSGVTHVCSLDALANGAAQMGAVADLGATFDDEYLVFLVVPTGTAPVAGTTVELYLVCSRDGSQWPAKVTGSDAAYTLGTSDANLKQAGAPVVSLIATADADTVQVQAPAIWRPRGRYVAPIVDNNLGQAFKDYTPNSDSTARIILVPRQAIITD